MKHNAYTTQPVDLYKRWGDDNMMDTWVLPENTPVMVIFSPIHQRYIVSISCVDYRYDAFIEPGNFRYDHTLRDDGPAYYLERAAAASKNFQK